MKKHRRVSKIILTVILPLLLAVFWPGKSLGYSVLSHEAVVDASWAKTIKPLLLQKYPEATPEELLDAHAYAYGGAITPDIGYFPLGSKLFTNLLHYVRSGDFVTSLIEEAHTVQEYAFALGVLCHYNADKFGHPLGVNPSAPLVYPKVYARLGSYVTYEQDPLSHVRTEFGFDVLQTGRGNYAPEAYHDFIGFKIASDVLGRAFKKTYGLDIESIFLDFDLSVKICKWATLHIFPTLTKMAWAHNKKDIQASHPEMTKRKYAYRIRLEAYENEFGYEQDKPGFALTAISHVMRVFPKIGPLRKYKIEIPGADAEKLFVKSFDTVVANCSIAMENLKNGRPCFFNIDYDTGNDSHPGEYGLADKNYSLLLLKLHKRNFNTTTRPLRRNIVLFFNGMTSKPKALPDRKWNKTMTALDELKKLDVPMPAKI